MLLRPEQVELHPAQGPGTRARVVDTVFYGHDGLVRLRLDDGQHVLSRVRGAVPPVGVEVRLRCRDAVLAYPR